MRGDPILSHQSSTTIYPFFYLTLKNKVGFVGKLMVSIGDDAFPMPIESTWSEVCCVDRSRNIQSLIQATSNY
jgi:hypothetical protein